MSERVAIVTGAGGPPEVLVNTIGTGRLGDALLDTAATRQFVPAEALAHAITPEAIAHILVYLASDSAGPVSGAVVPAYGA